MAAIKIGNKIEKESFEAVTDSIERIFDSAHQNRMDQETVRQALSTLGSIGEIKGTTITNSNFTGRNL